MVFRQNTSLPEARVNTTAITVNKKNLRFDKVFLSCFRLLGLLCFGQGVGYFETKPKVKYNPPYQIMANYKLRQLIGKLRPNGIVGCYS